MERRGPPTRRRRASKPRSCPTPPSRGPPSSPAPRLIAGAIAPGETPDLERLRAALAEQVPPASLDDHREFVDHMRLMSRAMVAGATGVLALVMIATVLSVTFATRGVMATNRQV